MFHPDTQFLIDYWISLAGRPESRGGAPYRSTLEPDALGLRLPRTFMVERRNGDIRLRLVGGWIEALHAAALTDRALLSLWRAESREMAITAVQRSTEEARPVVINATIGAAASSLEITLAPLRSPSGKIDRLLGLYTSLSSLTLTRDESRQLTGRFVRAAPGAARTPLSLAAIDGRRVA
jgi:hypothetical protein